MQFKLFRLIQATSIFDLLWSIAHMLEEETVFIFYMCEFDKHYLIIKFIIHYY